MWKLVANGELPYNKVLLVADVNGGITLAVIREIDKTLYVVGLGKSLSGEIEYWAHVEDLPNKNNNFKKWLAADDRGFNGSFTEWLKFKS